MKQRLLLALLSLFAMVGMVKAEAGDNTLVITPTGKTEVKVSITGGNPTFTETTGVKGENNNHSITIATGTTSELTITCVSATSISVSGGIKSIDLNNNSITSLSLGSNSSVESLTLTSANGLASLNCSNWGLNSLAITKADKLTNLNLSGNKLIYKDIKFPEKFKKPTWGTQKTTWEFQDGNPKANESLDINRYIKYFFGENAVGKVTITKPTEAYNENSGATDFVFVKQSGNDRYYTEGTFKFTLKGNSKTDYEGVAVEVSVTVDKAKLTWGADESVNAFKNGTQLQDNEEIFQGDIITLNAKKVDGKAFKEYTVSALKEEKVGNLKVETGARFIVNAKVSESKVTAKVNYDLKPQTITFEQPKGGTIIVKRLDKETDNNVISGGTVPYGTKVEITLEANENYEIESLMLGTDPNNPKENESQKLSRIVEIKNALNIVATCKLSTAGDFKIAVIGLDKNGGDKVFINGVDKSNNFTSDELQSSLLTKAGDKIQLQLKDAEDKWTVSVTPNAEEAITAKSQNGYKVYDYEIKENNTYITIKRNTLIEAVVNLASTSFEKTFNGKAQPLILGTDYSLNPKDLKNVKVTYKLSTDASAIASEASNDFPKNAGKYTVTISRAKDSNYKKLEKTATYTIKAATVEMATAPTVALKNDKSNYEVKSKGAFRFNNQNVPGKVEVTTTKVTTDKPHLVEIKFTAGEDKNGTFVANTNYDEFKTTVEVKIDGKGIENKYKVIPTDKYLPEGVKEIVFKNGNNIVKPGEFVEGTTLTFDVKCKDNYSYDDTNKPTYSIIKSDGTEEKKLTEGSYTVTAAATITVNAPTKLDPKGELAMKDKIEKKVSYTGEPVQFVLTDLQEKSQEGVELTSFYFEYKNEKNEKVEIPVNAGTYTVLITRPATKNWKAVSVTGKITIDPLQPKMKNGENYKLKTTLIAKGQPLSTSTITGDPAYVKFKENGKEQNVAGEFKWDKEVANPKDGEEYDVYFAPYDKVNYKQIKGLKATVRVSDKMLLTYATPLGGTLEVTDSNGGKYASETVITNGTKLTIKATPASDQYELASLTVNGAAWNNGAVWTVKDKSIHIVATFKIKDANPASVIITLPTSTTGAILSKTGAQEVAFNGNLTFTVATLAADKGKVVVRAGSDVITPNASGVYTVKADEKKSVSVTVTNPTAITVKTDTTLTPAKKPMGKVEIQGWTSTKKYYYGDQIVVTAFPESGVTFKGWKDITDKSNPLEVTLTNASYTFKAVYSGIPTGVESIEGTKIYGAKGYISISCDGDAQATIVSMNGQSRQIQVSGDARINIGAGIYGVILQKGSEVIRTKVVVR